MMGKKTVLVTYAVKEEFIPVRIEGCEIIHLSTGVGKAKSAYYLTKQFYQKRPDMVLNVGSAGTLKHNIGDIFLATHFIDRDYETIQLPGIEYEIELSHLLNQTLKHWVSRYEKTGTCNTGDTFVTKVGSITGDIIDMEAYAQAFVCKQFDIPFLAVKYVTDIIGSNSVEDWEKKLPDACCGLLNWFEEKKLLQLIGSLEV